MNINLVLIENEVDLKILNSMLNWNGKNNTRSKREFMYFIFRLKG